MSYVSERVSRLRVCYKFLFYGLVNHCKTPCAVPVSESLSTSLIFLLPAHTVPYQEVAVGERSRGGRLLEEPKMMLFRGNTFSLQVSIQDVPQLLWSIKPFTTCQVGCSYCQCLCDSYCKEALGFTALLCPCTFILFDFFCSAIRTLRHQLACFLLGHIKAKGQQRGHSRSSLRLAFSPPHMRLQY